MTLAHDVAGTGPAVVLLHSALCDRRMWDPQWPALADYRAVRCDFRGFGETPAPVEPHSDADDVVALLDTLDVERATLVGSSYGGRVAVELAARHPDRVNALALLCPALAGQEPSPELRQFREREMSLIESTDIAAAVELNLDTWLGPEASKDVREAVRLMLRHAFEIQLPVADLYAPITVEFDPSTIRCPSLILSGGHDLVDFRLIAARLAGLLADSHHVELPWAGHLPSLERPAAMTDLLVGFLRQKSDTRGPSLQG